MTTMTKKLKWRLSEKPTPDSVIKLIDSGIITKEEAKDILFTPDDQEERDKESLKSEIKFLRELVEKLSNNRSQIVTTIKEIEVPRYRQWDWYQPYVTWCGTPGDLLHTTGTLSGSELTFNAIQTF